MIYKCFSYCFLLFNSHWVEFFLLCSFFIFIYIQIGIGIVSFMQSSFLSKERKLCVAKFAFTIIGIIDILELLIHSIFMLVMLPLAQYQFWE